MILHPIPGQGHYGAARRKNVDNPSLKGLRWEPIGSNGKHAENKWLAAEAKFGRFHWEPRPNLASEGSAMLSQTSEIEGRLQRLKGRETRTQSIATRFTRTEERALLRVAASCGKNLREWAREVLLDAANAQQHGDGAALFAEVQALRLLLINTLEPLLRGEKMTPEQFKEMLRYVKTNKRKAAADMLASYAEGTTEQP
ncbi:hypothetical protein [Acidobacterium sp. S8]|nr:hypothetical protein [Acidobacterium sp. S8]